MDPSLRDALDLIQQAKQALRESVVQMVMRRNRLEDEVKRLELLLTDLDQKAALAEKINNPGLAAEIRREAETRQGELQRARDLLAQAETEAEAAKVRLPE